MKRDELPQLAEEGATRIVMRRRRPALAFSSHEATDAEGEVRDLNAEVEEAARAAPAALPSPNQQPQGNNPDLQSIANNNAEEFSPATRLRQIRQRASEYEQEFRLTLVHRMLMRKVPLDEIAAQLQISVSTVERDRKLLGERLRQAAREMNIDEMIGDNSGFYDEVAAMALRGASIASHPMPIRLAAMRTALTAKNDKHRFLQAAGVYDVLRFRRTPGGDGMNDIQRMLKNMDDMMAEASREQREAAGPSMGGIRDGDNDPNL